MLTRAAPANPHDDSHGLPDVLPAGLHRGGDDDAELRVPGRGADGDPQLPVRRARRVQQDRLYHAVRGGDGGVLGGLTGFGRERGRMGEEK